MSEAGLRKRFFGEASRSVVASTPMAAKDFDRDVERIMELSNDSRNSSMLTRSSSSLVRRKLYSKLSDFADSSDRSFLDNRKPKPVASVARDVRLRKTAKSKEAGAEGLVVDILKNMTKPDNKKNATTLDESGIFILDDNEKAPPKKVKKVIVDRSKPKKDKSLLKKDKSSAKKEKTTVKKDKSMVKKDRATVKKDKSMVKKDKATAKNDSKPVKQIKAIGRPKKKENSKLDDSEKVKKTRKRKSDVIAASRESNVSTVSARNKSKKRTSRVADDNAAPADKRKKKAEPQSAQAKRRRFANEAKESKKKEIHAETPKAKGGVVLYKNKFSPGTCSINDLPIPHRNKPESGTQLYIRPKDGLYDMLYSVRDQSYRDQTAFINGELLKLIKKPEPTVRPSRQNAHRYNVGQRDISIASNAGSVSNCRNNIATRHTMNATKQSVCVYPKTSTFTNTTQMSRAVYSHSSHSNRAVQNRLPLSDEHWQNVGRNAGVNIVSSKESYEILHTGRDRLHPNVNRYDNAYRPDRFENFRNFDRELTSYSNRDSNYGNFVGDENIPRQKYNEFGNHSRVQTSNYPNRFYPTNAGFNHYNQFQVDSPERGYSRMPMRSTTFENVRPNTTEIDRNNGYEIDYNERNFSSRNKIASRPVRPNQTKTSINSLFEPNTVEVNAPMKHINGGPSVIIQSNQTENPTCKYVEISIDDEVDSVDQISIADGSRNMTVVPNNKTNVNEHIGGEIEDISKNVDSNTNDIASSDGAVFKEPDNINTVSTNSPIVKKSKNVTNLSPNRNDSPILLCKKGNKNQIPTANIVSELNPLSLDDSWITIKKTALNCSPWRLKYKAI